MWIDATGCTHLHGGERPMLSLLSGYLARHGLTGRLAIADTPGAAHALARHGSEAMTLVEPGAHAAALAPLPFQALRLDGTMVDGLRRGSGSTGSGNWRRPRAAPWRAASAPPF